MEKREKYAIIVAAGKGVRMGKVQPKQFLPLLGKPLLHYTLQAFLEAFEDIHLVLVLPELTASENELIKALPHKNFLVIKGGDTRFDSVRNGLQTVKRPAVVFVHDGVRPLVSAALIRACYEQALKKGNAIPALPMKDSIRRVKADHTFAENRANFRRIQTPQTFLSEILLPAFDQPYEPAFTDEATVVEKTGHVIHLIEGEEQNIKITRPLDMLVAEQILMERNRTAKG